MQSELRLHIASKSAAKLCSTMDGGRRLPWKSLPWESNSLGKRNDLGLRCMMNNKSTKVGRTVAVGAYAITPIKFAISID